MLLCPRRAVGCTRALIGVPSAFTSNSDQLKFAAPGGVSASSLSRAQGPIDLPVRVPPNSS